MAKISQILSILSFIISASMLGGTYFGYKYVTSPQFKNRSMAAFGFVAIRYMQSPEFERDLKNKLMGDLKEKMMEEIPLQIPKTTYPAMPL